MGELVGVVHRRHQGVLVAGAVRVGRRGAAGLLGERGDEVVVDARRGQHPGGGGAVLPGVEVAGDGDGLGGGLEVGVVEDDDRRLAAEFQVHPLHVAAPPPRRPPCPARTEPVIDDHLRDAVLDQRPAGVPVAADDVEHARREELGGQLGQPQRRHRRGVARLEDDGVAGRDRRGDLPDRHHHRVVPRRDLADRRRSARGGPTTCARPCTRPPPCPPDCGPHRRRTGSGRPSAGSPRSRSARSACRCCGSPGPPARRRAPRPRRRS